MVLLTRMLVSLIGLACAAVLAIVGGAAAVFCIQGGHGTLSLSKLASDARLPQLRDDIATLLDRLTAHGPVAVVAALAGLGAVLLGVVMVVGALLRTRQRAFTLSADDAASIGAQRRALAQVAGALAEQPAAIRRARARARPWRRRIGGRLKVRAEYWAQTSTKEEATAAVRESLSGLTDSLPLELRIRVRAHSEPARERVR